MSTVSKLEIRGIRSFGVDSVDVQVKGFVFVANTAFLIVFMLRW